MKASRMLVAAVAGAAVLSVGSVVRAQGILDSAHDFSLESWNLTGTACGACHTAHNAVNSQLVPLWNHETADPTSFTMYDSTVSGSMDATVTTGEPQGASLACLSCHDGVTAVDSYGGATGSTIMSGRGAIGAGGDLTDDHPISITYDTALLDLDPYLRDPSTATIDPSVPGLGDGPGGPMTVQDALLKGVGRDQVECTSCHDPHAQKGTQSLFPGAQYMFLVIDSPKGEGYDRSMLCLQCHIK